MPFAQSRASLSMIARRALDAEQSEISRFIRLASAGDAAAVEIAKDEQRAARQLDRALDSLPISLVPKINDTLMQRVAMLT